MTGPKLVGVGGCVCPVETWNPLKAAGDKEFSYVDLSAVDQERKEITGARRIACAEAPSRARQLVEEGDVLISTVRPNLNGVARVGASHHGATASTGFCVLRPVAGKLDSSYLFQWVKSPNFVADMVSKATGASYPAVSDRIILESRIPLPPLHEQRRIAAILDQADALRAMRREALAQLDSLTQSSFIEMFGDPVGNPKGWEKRPLGTICEVGSSKRVFVEELVAEGIPFYRGTEVGQLGEDLEVTPSLFISEEHYERLKSEAGVPRPGDLLLPSICPDGRIFSVEHRSGTANLNR